MKKSDRLKAILEVIEYLEELGNGEIDPENDTQGLCLEIDNYFSDYNFWGDFLVSGYMLKGKHIGEYPIAYDPDSEFSSNMDAFNATGNLWDETPYGDNRRQFCLDLAEQIREDWLIEEPKK